MTHYLNAYPSIAEPAVPPTSLVNFGEAVNFPFIVAGIVTVFGAATLIHLLIISVSRRRRELALLRVLGFVNRQIVFTVAWQATVIALIGAVVGVPLGIVLGRTIWLAFASRLGVVPVAIVDIPVITALVICILLVANLLAVRAGCRRPAHRTGSVVAGTVRIRGSPSRPRSGAPRWPGGVRSVALIIPMVGGRHAVNPALGAFSPTLRVAADRYRVGRAFERRRFEPD